MNSRDLSGPSLICPYIVESRLMHCSRLSNRNHGLNRVGVPSWMVARCLVCLWGVLSHASDKNKNVAQIYPTNEDLFVGTPKDGHLDSCLVCILIVLLPIPALCCLSRSPRQPGYAAGVVPIGYIDIGSLVDVASMCGTEESGGDFAGLKLIVGPLLFLWVVAEESHWRVIAVKNGDAAFELRYHSEISKKAYLAGAAQMLRDGADELTIEIEVAQAAVFAIANQHQRLIVARVH